VSRVVVDLFGVEGANDAELISNATNMFEKGANVLAALPEGLEWMLRRKAFEVLSLKLSNGLTTGNRLRHGLSIHLG
jgi:hypothetical protein